MVQNCISTFKKIKLIAKDNFMVFKAFQEPKFLPTNHSMFLLIHASNVDTFVNMAGNVASLSLSQIL